MPVSGTGTAQSTTHTWVFSMFVLERYANPSLHRPGMLIGMGANGTFHTWNEWARVFVANAAPVRGRT